MTRIEMDSLGKMELPDKVYYGIQTARAIKNFPVSGIRERPGFVKAYVILKKGCALSNMELGELDKKKGDAIVKASNEILVGKFGDQFHVDVFQAGAGTSFNMNINEVIANRALEILGKEKGDYDYLSPNNHVNMGQSTNDTFPTASHIAVINESEKLLKIVNNLAEAFIKKGDEFRNIPKSGRTHLMDAMPVTLGEEFRAYGICLERAKERLKQRQNDLLELAIGGTATGTGINAHPKFRETVLKKLTELCRLPFREAKNSFEAIQSRSQLAAFSSSLKELALELIRIANDLRLLGSGPTTGLSEIVLPPVQPGSSIMPGKVNPVMAECLDMVAFQVIGNDTTVSLATQAGQMELNVMTPVIIYNILESIAMLNNYLPVFQKKCIDGIIADEDRCKSYLKLNPSLATLLSPKIGYLKAAELAKESLERGVEVLEIAIEKGLITKDELIKLFDIENIASNKYK